MDVRIDYISEGPQPVVRISGRLSSPVVAQLYQACDQIEDPFVIDLSSLLYADKKGIAAIRAIADKGAQIHGASPFVQLLLDKASAWHLNGEESRPS